LHYEQLIFFGLPLDYWNHYAQAINAVDKAAVRKAAEGHLRPTDFKVVVVGDREKVLPSLQEAVAKKTFGNGPLVELDADGKVMGKKR
jgi:hypothetical protein